MEIKIKRKEATISSDTIEIPAQGSANIPVVLENDSSYSNYIKEVHCGYYLNGVYCKVILPIENEKYLIPLEAFKFSGPLYLAVALVNVKEIIKTNQINFEVRAAPNGKVILPTENEWHILVKNYMDSLFENDYGDRFDEIGTNLEEMAAEVQTQQEKITSQQTQIDNAIGNMGDYEIVQEDPVQIRFKKGDGTFGETVDLGDGLASKAMVNAGYYTYKGISYDGSASNNGIDVAEIDGAYSQETTTGKNLLNITSTGGTNNGITYTINDDKSVTLNGATTDAVSQLILNIMTIPNGTYCLNGTNTANVYMRIWSETQQKEIYKSVNSGSFEITNNDVCQIQIYIHKGVTCNNVIIYPQLELGSTATSYEPYTGGIASPNPEYPQEPKFVGDIGQNLFNASKLPTKSQGGATVTNNGDGSFTISGSGTLTSDFSNLYAYSHDETIKLLKAGNIYLKSTTSVPRAGMGIYVDGKVKYVITDTGKTTISQEDLNNPTTYLYLSLYGAINTTITPITIKPMLYQDGNGEYRPFSETPKYYLDFVTSGKNLFNINGNVNVDGYSKEQKTTNTVENGVLTCNVNGARNHGVGQRLYGLKGKTISVSAKLKSLGEATIGNIYIYESSGAYKAVSNATALDTVFAINNYTCQTDDIVVAFSGTGGTGVQFYDIMVNYGAKFVDYEPFTGFETTTVELNQPLRELPNGVKDTIENGVVTRRVGEITFDGSSDESWNFDTTYKYAAIGINGVTGYNIGVKNILCDKLYVLNSNGSISGSTNVIRYGSSDNNNKILYVRIDDTITSVSEFKTWLQSNPITVWYELATPTTEQITLPTLPSWYPYTNAWVGTELQPSFVEWHIKIAGVNQNDLTVIKEDISQLQTETTQLNDDVTRLMGAFTSVTDLTKQLFLLMHRVGDIIFSTSDENPSTIYGGTWVAWGKGQVPVGVDSSDNDFNTVEKTGGEKEHTLTVDETPSHKHDIYGGNTTTTNTLSSSNNNGWITLLGGMAYKNDGTMTTVGNDEPHNNLQPYITCYMWKRIA